MRTLSARAWDKKRNCWNYAVLEFDADGVLDLGDDYELVLSTGLHDKNGVEIYEGDIISDGLFAMEVTYGLTGFLAGGEELWSYDGEPYRVIGNIYENPELLESPKEDLLQGGNRG